jgi:hypothetical protein
MQMQMANILATVMPFINTILSKVERDSFELDNLKNDVCILYFD